MTKSETPIRSWVVKIIDNKPQMVGEFWQPGYTPAHFATQDEAREYAYFKLMGEAQEIRLLAQTVFHMPNA